MAFMPTQDFYLEVQKGNVPKHSIVHKFGEGSASTALAPICKSGFYRMPTAATALEFVSDSANDAAAGSGASEITIVGINSAWVEVEQILVPNGTTAVALTTDLLRLHRWYVSEAGTYADQFSGSHAGNLTIREASAGQTWSTIGLSPFPEGQSEIGFYTIPIGHVGHVLSHVVIPDSNKSISAFFFQRPKANDVSAPYTGVMRLVNEYIGISEPVTLKPKSPGPPFVGPCDIGFLAKTSQGSGEVAIEFETMLIED